MSDDVDVELARLGWAPVTSRRRRKYKTKSFNKSWTWDWDFPMGKQELFLASSDLSDHVTNRVMLARYEMDVETLTEEISFLCHKKDWMAFAKKQFNSWKFFEFSDNDGAIVDTEAQILIKYQSHPSSVKLKIYGAQTDIDDVIGGASTKFDPVDCYIEWMYSGDGSSVEIPLRPDRLPFSELYPFLKDEALEDYYDRFMESDASILLLIGPPGTGKTSFIRGLLQHRKTSAVVTYDASILEKDYVFARFIENESEIMVFEDADAFLKSRKDGNTMMHKFLNVGDGLVTTKGKKLIFSTNLPSIKEVDPALVRPGRCFDILTFDTLNAEQAQKAAKAIGVKLDDSKTTWSVADLFNQQDNAPQLKESKIGFI